MKKNISSAVASRYKSMVYYYCCHILGNCPTKKEMENDNVQRLANRLRGGSREETLTNVLEWQNRNITFWTERHPLSTVSFYSGLPFIMGLIFFILLIIIGAPSLGLIVLVVSSIPLAMTLVMMVWILRANRKTKWKEVPRSLWNAFVPSISMNFLLERKLGVCRDYAKITACLLSNYPQTDIYFATAPGHVATGVKIENRLYMLDQRLPILTKEKWNDYRKPWKYIHGTERFDPVTRTLSKADNVGRTSNNYELNTKELARKMKKLLNVEEQPDDKATLLEVPILWEKGAKLYEDDELVNYSLARYLKMRISSELIEMNRIRGIEITRAKDDLTFLIHFS